MLILITAYEMAICIGRGFMHAARRAAIAAVSLRQAAEPYKICHTLIIRCATLGLLFNEFGAPPERI